MALTGILRRWEDDQNVAVAVTDQESRMAKLILESRWGVKHEYGPNRSKRTLDRYCQKLPREELQLLDEPGKRSWDWFDDVLEQPIPRNKKSEMRENSVSHHRGDRSKCHHPVHHGYQWKNRDMDEAQASLRRYLVEGSTIIQTVDPLRASTQANESVHAKKGEYTDKRLNSTTSTEARFALGVISQSRNPDGKASYANP
jgi:hypothetical protein